MDHLNSSNYCAGFLTFYTANLTASYTETRNELTTVPASLIMFILTGLFFTLNLFSGISGVSAILDPKVRLFLSSVLSLFLPVMSYLFSEAKNIGGLGSESSTITGLSPRARLILTWMLLVEILRRKVDEIRVRGYLSTIQRAGRVVWLGSLVFFNINVVGQKALFSILWILCVTRLLQRIVFTEVEKRSYAHGKNPGLINSYMAQMLQDHKHHHQRLGDHEVIQGGHEMLKRCKYIVMGEEKLVKKVTAYGYELNAITPSDSIITVGKVWELAESDRLFTVFDQNQRLRRLCLSFALFKLLRRRFEHLPAVTSAEEEARDSRDLILKGLHGSGESTAEALFQVMNDEVNFLCEYNHSVAPVVLASPFFLLVNYFLIHVAVFGFCLMAIILCGNGDVRFTLETLSSVSIFQAGISRVGICFLKQAAVWPSAVFVALDFFITIILLIIFFYEEIWEFFIFLLSNWFMVSLLCNYMTKPQWRESLIFTHAFRFLMLLRSKTRNTNLHLKQFSVLDLSWPPISTLPATLSLKVKTALVPNNLKQSIMEYMVEHDHGTNHYTPLTNGKSALRRNNLFGQLSWACNSNSVAEVALTWHIATCLLEVECPTRRAEEASPWKVAMRLSKYCAYLVLFHPELLPDNQENLELIPEDISEELKNILGSWDYYFSSRQSRVKKIMESIRGGDTTTETTTGWTEIQVEATGKGDQNKVVTSGAKLGKLLMNEANSSNLETVWKVLADVWTELIIYIAVSSDKERVKDVLVHGDELVTLLWVLTMHTGISSC
ncbi:hypothetical protein GQ55_7G096600 [Panicum hallii var. hallii]|uniref:DUF4220 domain-containing protein n=2 Tax=Panicum hallii var. hallii TaxID=1504633 RepID=A0A2T7CTF2_9POAL|nr:hypothetical protein GQ55_7G096600 [Panicum hallii var. hallii]